MSPGNGKWKSMTIDVVNEPISKVLEQIKDVLETGLIYSPSLLRDGNGNEHTITIRIKDVSAAMLLEYIARAIDCETTFTDMCIILHSREEPNIAMPFGDLDGDDDDDSDLPF